MASDPNEVTVVNVGGRAAHLDQLATAAPVLLGTSTGCACQNSHTASDLVSYLLVRLLPIFTDQAMDDVPAHDPGSPIDRLAGLLQQRSLFSRLVRPVLVVAPRARGEDLPEVLFAVDQQVVEALAP